MRVYFPYFWRKNLLSIHIMYYKADQIISKYSPFKGPPTATAI